MGAAQSGADLPHDGVVGRVRQAVLVVDVADRAADRAEADHCDPGLDALDQVGGQRGRVGRQGTNPTALTPAFPAAPGVAVDPPGRGGTSRSGHAGDPGDLVAGEARLRGAGQPQRRRLAGLLLSPVGVELLLGGHRTRENMWVRFAGTAVLYRLVHGSAVRTKVGVSAVLIKSQKNFQAWDPLDPTPELCSGGRI